MSFEMNPDYKELDNDGLKREIERTLTWLRGEGVEDPAAAEVREYLTALSNELESRRRENREQGLQNGETVPVGRGEQGYGKPELHAKRLRTLQAFGIEIGIPYELPPGADLTDEETFEDELSRMDSYRAAKEELERAASNASDPQLAGMDITDRIKTALEIIIESGELDDEIVNKLIDFLRPENLALFVTIVTVFIVAGSNPVTFALGLGMLFYWLGDLAYTLGTALYHLTTADTVEEYETGVVELFDFLARAGSDLIILISTAGLLKSRPGRIYRVRVRRGFGRLSRGLRGRLGGARAGSRTPPPPPTRPPHRAYWLKPKSAQRPEPTPPRPTQPPPRGGYAEPPTHFTEPPPRPGPLPELPTPRGFAEPPTRFTQPPPHPETFNPGRTYAVKNQGYSTGARRGMRGRDDFYTAFQRSGPYRRSAVFIRPRENFWQRGPRFLNETEVPSDIKWGPWQLRKPGLGTTLRGSTRQMLKDRYKQLFGREPRSDFEARHALSNRTAQNVYSMLNRSQLIEIVTRALARAHMRRDFPSLTDRRFKWFDLTRPEIEQMSRDDLVKLAADLFYNNPEYIWYGPRNMNQLKGGAIMGGRNPWADLDLPPEMELFGRTEGKPLLDMSTRPGYRGVMDRFGRLTELQRIVRRRLAEGQGSKLQWPR